MIDYNKQVVSALKEILPTHYELALTSKTQTPCYSYQEANNYDTDTGDTFGYSRISFTIKTWANDIATIQKYSLLADKALRAIGFKRVASGELYDNQSTMIQKISTYEALASENY